MQYSLKKQSNEKSDKPYFWFLDFNCEQDPETSNIVEDSINVLNKHGFNNDNTIFAVCSDHGYPDPASGITPKKFLNRKN